MIQSLERASTILHLFEQQPDWGITQIAEQMQLSKSTVFGLVSTLEHLGFLSKKQDTDRYCLGLELYRLGNLVDTDTHPSSSYALVRDANKQYTLRITNPQIFWSTSKYLVVLVK